MFNIVDVVVEANPNNFQLLCERVRALAQKEDPSFVRLKQIDHLHFMSLQIFQDRHFDPLLVFENNFDGDDAMFWKNVLQQIGEDLRAIFACTKPAIDPQWARLFTDGSTLPLEPFIKAYSAAPSAAHMGAVGVTVKRVNRDLGVFEAIQAELGSAGLKYRRLKPVDLQSKIRAWALTKYDWLNKAESESIPREKALYKWAAIRAIVPLLVAAAILIPAAGFLCFSDFLPNRGYAGARNVLVSLIVFAVLGAVAGAICFWKTLRRLEESDWTQDDPSLDPAQLAAFAAQEDQIVQNHLGSMVLVKAGVVRSILIRGSLRLLKLAVPLVASDGYLGSMRTIHFAHWTLIGNTGRLMFLSNFDGSWQSYLDDFVDKAHRGLTLAWGNCVGFPRTRDLIEEGATHGREFKAWARQSQTQNILWYSAYKDLTVNQILRNASIVDGLRKPAMTEAEANEWALLL
jgi:hypothetical protein